MPKQIKDLRDFLTTARRPGAKSVKILRIAEAGGATTTKFKIRCAKYLYTLIIKDVEKAKKLEQSLPPGALAFWLLGTPRCSRDVVLSLGQHTPSVLLLRTPSPPYIELDI